MVRRLLFGLLACGAVWICGTSIGGAHDGWADPTADDTRRHVPPDIDGLSVYGEWVWEPVHGRVWRPYVDADWRPYWRGHWAWRGTWVWVSADPWGGGPFHYGEWVWSAHFGWVWIPGTVWAPARVTWIISGPVIAWAPASLHVTLGTDPRFLVFAESRTFRGAVVRPHRIPPSHVNLRAGIVTKDIGRVIAPDPRPPRREVRARAPRERTFTVGTDPRVVPPRSSPSIRAPAHDATRARANEFGRARGFDRRESRDRR